MINTQYKPNANGNEYQPIQDKIEVMVCWTRVNVRMRLQYYEKRDLRIWGQKCRDWSLRKYKDSPSFDEPLNPHQSVDQICASLGVNSQE